MPYHENLIISRPMYLMLLMVSCIGRTTSIMLPKIAIVGGTMGHLVAFVLIYAFVGVPVLFMEITVSQFTSRDCIDVWRARACLSHLGYLTVAWQGVIMLYSHVVTSIVVYYLMISFENPVPYYMCGKWSNKDCKILLHNYTVNSDCIRTKYPESYCADIYKTHPEYQYWKFYVLEGKDNKYHVAWRVCAASALVSIILCVSCFKRIKTMKWFLVVYSIYPFLGFVILMLGSMLQKGLVAKFDDAFDMNFSSFVKKFSLSTVIENIVFAVCGGTGLMMNLSSRVSFRSPCFTSAVLLAACASAFTTLTTVTSALMICAYSFEYGLDVQNLMNDKQILICERMPKMLLEYDHHTFFLILAFTTNTVVGLGKENVIFFSLTEMLMTRNKKFASYPGLISLLGAIVIFIVTIPLISEFGIYVAMLAYRRNLYSISVFVCLVECITFIYCYGLDKLSEDVHFMQGIKPSSYMKFTWLTVGLALVYTFSREFYIMVTSVTTLSDKVGTFMVIAFIGLYFFIFIVKLLVATLKKRLKQLFRLDPKWGPQEELLKRSRAMFSAQAMTKEYIYRQYHLQAGIIARQRASNVRGGPRLPG